MDADKTIRNFCEHWNRSDIDAIVDSFTDDATYHNIPMEPCKGKEAIRIFVGGMFGGMAKSVHFEIKHQVVNGSIVMNERVDTITLQDRKVALPVCGVFEMNNDGKISAWRDYFDLAQFTGN
ncbi:MAG: limonene-1,2-epoxide hydrolase family protein [Myxococcota bacterium]|nr:limonene-1,2-epoxide hydrolase family protein [Myxococcota bacterium]